MNSPTSSGLAPRERAHTIIHEVLDRRRPLDEVLQSDRRFAKLETRDRAFARNLIATTLRRLGQIDAIIDDCLDRPLPRSAPVPIRLPILLGRVCPCHEPPFSSVSRRCREGPPANRPRHRTMRFAGALRRFRCRPCGRKCGMVV